MQRHQRVDADAKADGDGGKQVLDGEDEGECRHGVLADLRHKQAVYDVIKGVDQHRDDVGQGHGDQQREDRPLFHKGVVHGEKAPFRVEGELRRDAKKPHNGFCTIVWRKIADDCKNPHDILGTTAYHKRGGFVKCKV